MDTSIAVARKLCTKICYLRLKYLPEIFVQTEQSRSKDCTKQTYSATQSIEASEKPNTVKLELAPWELI